MRQQDLNAHGFSAKGRRPAPHSEKELRIRCQALEGVTIEILAKQLGYPLPKEPKRAKGYIGQLVERALGADPKAGDQPDFPDLGIELKTIPISPTGKTAESTFCCAITMKELQSSAWIGSRLEKKLRRVVWIGVQSSKTPFAKRHVLFHVLWSPNKEETKRLKQDWEMLMGIMASGGLINARLGAALQIRPKGANSKTRVTTAAADSFGLDAPVGFYLRPAFTYGLLHRVLQAHS